MKVIEVTFQTTKGGHGPIAGMPFHPSHGKICHQTSSRNWKIEKSLVFQRPVKGLQAVVSFPAFHFGNWDRAPGGFSEREFVMLIRVVMGINSLLWGLFLGLPLQLIGNRLFRSRAE
jgi:hypothetical protein